MKKIVFTFLILLMLVSVSGCGKKSSKYMDKPAEDGKYYYSNEDLGFEITFPEVFVYYQFQRKVSEGYTDLEFFVPSSDKKHWTDIQSYAKPVVVRIFNEEIWKNVAKDQDESKKVMYKKMGEKDGKIYTIKFWKNPARDWADKWNEDIQKSIEKSFEII